jgi:hypothetical protein
MGATRTYHNKNGKKEAMFVVQQERRVMLLLGHSLLNTQLSDLKGIQWCQSGIFTFSQRPTQHCSQGLLISTSVSLLLLILMVGYFLISPLRLDQMLRELISSVEIPGV